MIASTIAAAGHVRPSAVTSKPKPLAPADAERRLQRLVKRHGATRVRIWQLAPPPPRPNRRAAIAVLGTVLGARHHRSALAAWRDRVFLAGHRRLPPPWFSAALAAEGAARRVRLRA